MKTSSSHQYFLLNTNNQAYYSIFQMDLQTLCSSIVAARGRISPYVRHSPLEVSAGLSAETGASVYLKLGERNYMKETSI